MTDDERNELLPTLAGHLIEVAEGVEKVTPEERTQSEIWGVPFPPLDKYELAQVAMALADRIHDHAPTTVDTDSINWLTDAIKKVVSLKSNVVPQVFGGNLNYTLTYLTTLYALDRLLDKYLGWEGNPDLNKLPAKLAKRVNAAATRVDQLDRDTTSLEAKVQVILAAHDAADQLPVDLEQLRKAAESVSATQEQIIKAQQRVSDAEDEILRATSRARIFAEDAEKLVAQCDEAYRITTTTGLAASFDDRANKLRKSTNWWVVWLATALVTGCGLGAYRVAALSTVLSRDSLNWGAIALHMVLSVISVGAPLWFAWIATKQIQQRFKLAEDYAFKASVAKAYEGYRKEAARIDPQFESRLFASALTRLEEAPLRMIEKEPLHGGPWHELISSPGFKRALETSSELAERVQAIASGALSPSFGRRKASNEAPAATSDAPRTAEPSA